MKIFPGRLLTISVFLTGLFLSVFSYIYYTGNRMTVLYAPLIYASMQIKYEATLGHLWFEEIISGDNTEDIEQVWQHLGNADLYARIMLEGGRFQGRDYQPIPTELLTMPLQDVRSNIAEFMVVAQFEID